MQPRKAEVFPGEVGFVLVRWAGEPATLSFRGGYTGLLYALLRGRPALIDKRDLPSAGKLFGRRNFEDTDQGNRRSREKP